MLVATMLLVLVGCGERHDGFLIPTGTAWFRFPVPSTAQPARTIEVYTYRPESHGADDPIVMVMHGASRNADDYRDRWVEVADRYRLLIVAPRIDERGFSWEEFRLGGVVRNREEVPVPPNGPLKSDWTFTLMDRLFDHVRDVTSSQTEWYDFFGHSAGGQFAHRFAMFLPSAKTRVVISANSGWYTFPTAELPFPYGLGGFPDQPPLGPPDYPGLFGKRLVIMLGTADTVRDRNLLTTPEADAQGQNRLERGRAYHEAGKVLATRLDLPFRWEVVEVPGIEHSSATMIPHAARWLYGE
jgi:pimeloyl-ACP methyl ester carboxylesterase